MRILFLREELLSYHNSDISYHMARWVGFRSSPAIEWCCAISAIDFYYTVAVDIKILLMDGCDERWMENRREQTGEDLDPLLETYLK
jgi:hypothetical protein